MIIRPAGLLRREDRLLLMQYAYDGQVRLNLPGGKPDAGESLPQCLAREWQEELGVTIDVGPLVLVLETLMLQREVLHLLFQVTTADRPALDPRQTSAQSLVWLPLDQLARAPLYPAAGPALQAWLVAGEQPALYQGRVAQPWFE